MMVAITNKANAYRDCPRKQGRREKLEKQEGTEKSYQVFSRELPGLLFECKDMLRHAHCLRHASFVTLK